jgi:molecular chaperone DnaK
MLHLTVQRSVCGRAGDGGSTVGYDLGIDLGGTTVVAAVLRWAGGRPETVALGTDGALTLPATAHRGSDGTVRTGEDAEQRAAVEPDGVVRDVTARLGDEVPLVVGGEPWRADDVAAEIVLAAVRRVAAHEGGAARALAVTHPAGWGPHRERTLRRALVRVGLGHATLIAESRAAALAGSRGTVAGVYDLGGRSFRAAVVRRGPAGGTEVLADSGAPDRAGGTDIDAAVLALVREQLGDDLEAALEDLPDDEARLGLASLRDAAHAAKEQLSAETEARVAVELGSLRTTVRITRADLEARITPLVAATVESFASTVDAAGVPLDDVVLVGGSSRIPLVARLLAEELGRPVHPEADPVTVVAQGAALAAARHAAAQQAAARRPDEALTPAVPAPGISAGRARHRAPEPEDELDPEPMWDGAAARAGAAATAAMAAAYATGASAGHHAFREELDDLDVPEPVGVGGGRFADGGSGAAAPARSATALLERPRPGDDVPRPPVHTAAAPVGPHAEPGPLRRYRSWILAGITVVVLGAAAATVPIPGLTSARTAAPAPAPTTTPTSPAPPSASPSSAPAAPPAPTPAPSADPSSGTGSSSGDASPLGGDATGSSGGSSSGGASSAASSGTSGKHATTPRPAATRTHAAPAAQAPAAAVAPATPAPAAPAPAAVPSSAAPAPTIDTVAPSPAAAESPAAAAPASTATSTTAGAAS